MKKVVGLGACVFDTLIKCSEFPAEDCKKRADGVFVSGGGPVGNALVVMSKLGVNAALTGGLADDGAGKYMAEDFKRCGVDTSAVTTVKGATSFTSYIILSEKAKTRTCVFDRGTVEDNPDYVDINAIKFADILHLDGNYLNSALFAAKTARASGVKVSLDAGGLYDGIEKLLPYVDILIPSAEFALGLTGEKSIPAAMKKLDAEYSPEALVVTDGSRGGYYLDGCEIKHYESVKIDAADTNGAGDTFHGAFIAAYLKGKTVGECCKFASLTAAYKCMHSGVRTFELSEEIIENFEESLLNG